MAYPKVTIKIPIDGRKLFDRLHRRVNKLIYYNENCFVKLQSKEMTTIWKVLLALHDEHELHKNDVKYLGIKSSTLARQLEMSPAALKATVWMLIPQFVNIRSYGSELKVSRRLTLNENGLLLVDMLINQPDLKSETKKNPMNDDDYQMISMEEDDEEEDDGEI